MRYDYHVHSTYSDGSDMGAMVEAAAEAGLEGIGFADHCNVSAIEPGSSLSHDLDETFEDRREGITRLRDEADVRIFDAVEMDYRPEDEERIEAFLDEANFEYVIGSVHHVGGREVMAPGAFAEDSEDERAAFVERYFERTVELIDSALFDVVAHVDVTERNPELRAYATESQYRDVAAALADSSTVPELNAGRVFRGPKEAHPRPEFLDVLQEAGIRFVTGTDSHVPDEIADRAAYLSKLIDRRDVEVITL